MTPLRAKPASAPARALYAICSLSSGDVRMFNRNSSMARSTSPQIRWSGSSAAPSRKASDSVDKAVDEIGVDKSWRIAGGPAELDLDRVAIPGHPNLEAKGELSEEASIEVKIDYRGDQMIDDGDKVDRFRLRCKELLEKRSYLGVLDCLEGIRNEVA